MAKVAAVSARQPAIHQQQVAEQFKQTANERQHQVETAANNNHAGSVTTENLNQEQRQGNSSHEESGEKHGQDVPTDEEDALHLRATIPSDPVRGRTIDIKT